MRLTEGRQPAWSANGAEILHTCCSNPYTASGIYLTKASPLAVRRRLAPKHNRVHGPVWSRDGRSVAFGQDGDIYVIDDVREIPDRGV